MNQRFPVLQAPGQMSESPDNSPEDALHHYVKAFESKDCETVASFYHLPGMFISPHGVRVVLDVEAARSMADLLVKQSVSQNYRRTEIMGRHFDDRALTFRVVNNTDRRGFFSVP